MGTRENSTSYYEVTAKERIIMAKLKEYSKAMQLKLVRAVETMVLEGKSFEQISFDLNIPFKLAVECWQQAKADELI